MTSPAAGSRVVLDRSGIGSLLSSLRESGYTVLGPTARDGAIVYDEVQSLEDLPGSVRDVQTNGSYRLEKRADDALFGFVVGPQSWKKFLFPPELLLFRAHRSGRGFQVEPPAPESHNLAFFGVRACEAAALRLQDRVFFGGPFKDGSYQSRRQGVFIVAVQCTEPGGTCFCTSMGTGPRALSGFDLAITELISDGTHEFLVEVGTVTGARVLENVPFKPAAQEQWRDALERTRAAEKAMQKSLRLDGLREALVAKLESPRWEAIAQRCLGCANCTLVCPTCFCHTIEDRTDLAGNQASRTRLWDSCFSLEFSYIHGGSVRRNASARYRQWMTHKLAHWIDQFGEPGCVGCGRCITWCPVGIDITEEARFFNPEPASAAHA